MGGTQNLYTINEVKKILDGYGLLYHDISGASNMVQLGDVGERDTTIHCQKDKYICYTTDTDYDDIVYALRGNEIVIGLNFKNKDKNIANQEISNEESKWDGKIVTIFQGNSILNPSSAPKYQPHCIYAYGNEALEELLKLLAQGRSKMGMTKIDAVWIGTAVLTYNICQHKNNWEVDDICFPQQDIVKAAKDILGEEIPNALVSSHATANTNSQNKNCAYLSEVDDKKRRLSFIGEFDGAHEHPDISEMKDNIMINTSTGSITIQNLYDFVKDVYTPRMRELLKDSISDKKKKDIMAMNDVEKYDRNLILYGPPGTGKTYNSVNYAVAICEGKPLEEIQKEKYDDILERFETLKKAGRIAFTTFHQSYGYEEFIEGIKPVTDEETGNISYEITNGIFKDFCEKAELPQGTDINHEAQVYIVRLKDKGESDLKSECFQSGEIRFDWPEDYSDGWMKWFSAMKPGDYVMSYHSKSRIIDGVGVIQDEEPLYDDSKSSFKWTRKVNWIITGEQIDIFEANNGKYLSNFHVGRIPDMKLSSLLSLISGNTHVKEELKPCVFIIDEINRGNISKIFGELITLIEDTKRKGCAEEMKAVLPYSHTDFSVPENVYILGTMNTADRSIALMDTALRRRFSFVEMMPNSEVLDSLGVGTITDGNLELNVSEMLNTINRRIEYLYDREHTIGHAFFTRLKDSPNIETLAMIFKKNVIPLLQEYFYEDYAKIQYVLGDNQKESSLKFILDESLDTKEIFNGVPDIDLPEKKYRIQESAFYNLASYKGIGKNL